MLVYLDESGDCGFKFRKGSSAYFVVTLLLVDDPLDIQIAVDELRRDIGYINRPEFKFVSTRPIIRERFLYTIRDYDFLVRTLVVDKQLLTTPQMHERELFYNYLVRQILQHDQGRIREATLILDESVKSKEAKQAMATYLRRMLNVEGAQKIKKVQHRDSRNDNLIQAVDMISGAIYHRFERCENRYFNIIRPRIDDVWRFQPYPR